LFGGSKNNGREVYQMKCNAEAILAGAIIVSIMNNLSEPSLKKRSVILLFQAIRAKIRGADKKIYGTAADNAFKIAREASKKENLLLDIGIIVESIVFSLTDEMKECYGPNIISLTERASSKVTIDELEPTMKKKSYEVADLLITAIKEETRKMK
jgi:hypothetical protein